MCDEIGVIDGGKLIAHGSVSEIQAQLAGERHNYGEGERITRKCSTFFEEDPFISSIELHTEKNSVTFHYRGTEDDQINLLKKAMDHSITIISFSETETDLEDVFMEITKGAK